MKPKPILLPFLALAGSSLLAISYASAQTTYTWANSNVSNTPNTFDWFTGGPNIQGTWTGGTPVSNNLNTVQFFTSTATAVPNTTTVTQGSNVNNGGNAFELGILTFSGQAPAASNQDLTMNVTGDALKFSAATGTINLDSLDVAANGRNITWNTSNAIQLGTASSASTLTLTGNGSSTFNFGGGFTELQTGGGSKLIKSGSSTTTLSGVVTVSGGLEVNGGILRLTNASNAITGGITLNGGSFGDNSGAISTATLNNNNITVNGAANLGLTGGATTNGGITLNAGADLALATNNNSATVNGAVTGVGSISINRLGGGSHTQNLNSTANNFTGTVSFIGTSVLTLNVNSLADSASPGTGNIRFVGSAGTSAHTFALGSGAIAPVTLDNRRIEIVSGSAAAYTIANNSSQAFAINTDLLVGATGARTLTLGGTGTGVSTFGGKIEDGSGTVSISKAGSGTWILSGNNTYTGTTTVTAGNLITTKASALPGYDSAAKVIFNGGTVGVRVGGSGWTTAEVNTLLTNATKTSGALGIDTTNGDLTQWTAFTTSNLGSALGINKLGTNTLTLDQSNTFAGALTISQGTVSINTINNSSSAGVLGNSANAVVLGSNGNTGTLLYTGATASSNKTFTAATSGTGAINIQEAATNLTLSGAIGGSGNITKEGAGILTLGAANGYSGATTVNGGELRWGVANAIAAGALNINDGGTVNMQTFTDTVGTVTIAKGGNITGTTGVLTTGLLISNGGGTMTGARLQLASNAGITYNGGAGSSTLQIDQITVGDTGSYAFNIAKGDAAVDFDITGALNNFAGNNVAKTIIKSGAGVMQFSGSTASAGGTNGIFLNINEGTVLMNRATGVVFAGGSAHGITVGDGTGSAGTAILKFADTGGDNQLGNRAITINSDGLFDLNGKNQTTSGALTSANGGSITTGAGTLTLGNNTNTISGASTVTGNLTFTATSASALNLGGTASIISGTTTISGGNGSGITATGNTSIAGTLALGSNTRAIAVTGASDQLTVSAQMTGSQALTKSGSGSLTLSSSTSSWSGALTVQTGTLIAGADSPSGSAGAFGNATSDVLLGVANGNTDANILTGGAFNIGRNIRNATTNDNDTGTRVLTLGGNTAHNSEFSGNIFLGTTNQTSKGIQITAAAGGQVTFSGVIQNPTGQSGAEATAAAALTAVTKVGSGTVILSNTNTYTGSTVVSQGTLLTTKAAALPGYNAAGRVSVAGGATLAVRAGGAGEWSSTEIDSLLGATTAAFAATSNLGIDVTTGNTFTYAGDIGATQANKGLVKTGAGTLTLSTTHTYTGATNVNGGVLAVNGTLANTTTTIGNGGILQGSGLIAGSVTVGGGGAIAAGNSIESLGTGTLNLASGSTFAYEIDKSVSLTEGGDLTYVTGDLNITSDAILTIDELDTLSSGTWGLGEKLTLISYTGSWNSGLFTYLSNTLSDDSTFTFSGATWSFNYNDILAGGNFVGDLPGGSTFVTMTVIPEPAVNVIPEPSAFLLGSFGLLAAACRRRR